MNCADFKSKMPSEGDKNPELAEHLRECKACQEWLKQQLEQPPEGISSEYWQKITKKLTPTCEPDKNRQKTLSGSFFNGMTYGLVFGAAMVVGLAVIDIQKSALNKKQTSISRLDKNAADEANIAKYTEAAENCYNKQLYKDSLKFIDSDTGFNYVLIKLPQKNQRLNKAKTNSNRRAFANELKPYKSFIK